MLPESSGAYTATFLALVMLCGTSGCHSVHGQELAAMFLHVERRGLCFDPGGPDAAHFNGEFCWADSTGNTCAVFAHAGDNLGLYIKGLDKHNMPRSGDLMVCIKAIC